jgi:hypothetical protein
VSAFTYSAAAKRGMSTPTRVVSTSRGAVSTSRGAVSTSRGAVSTSRGAVSASKPAEKLYTIDDIEAIPTPQKGTRCPVVFPNNSDLQLMKGLKALENGFNTTTLNALLTREEMRGKTQAYIGALQSLKELVRVQKLLEAVPVTLLSDIDIDIPDGFAEGLTIDVSYTSGLMVHFETKSITDIHHRLKEARYLKKP